MSKQDKIIWNHQRYLFLLPVSFSLFWLVVAVLLGLLGQMIEFYAFLQLLALVPCSTKGKNQKVKMENNSRRGKPTFNRASPSSFMRSIVETRFLPFFPLDLSFWNGKISDVIGSVEDRGGPVRFPSISRASLLIDSRHTSEIRGA